MERVDKGIRQSLLPGGRMRRFRISRGLSYCQFDSKGVSLSGFGLTYQGDFVESMLHRVTNGRLQHEMLVKAAKSDKEGRKAIDATAGMGKMPFFWLLRV